MKISFVVYSLYRTEFQPDWFNPNDLGCLKETKVLESVAIINESSDNLCIGGYGRDGKYYQYDSYEGYHSYGYFEKDFAIHGLQVESKTIVCTVDELMKLGVQ